MAGPLMVLLAALGFAGGQRYLTIGMPLLLGITATEPRAVLAHEMGHDARGHTVLIVPGQRLRVPLVSGSPRPADPGPLSWDAVRISERTGND